MASAYEVTPTRYSHGAMLLHWLIALLLAFEISLGWRADDLPKELKGSLFALHKPVGIAILLLVALRILWRFTKRPPALPATLKPWEASLATWTHKLFYVFMFAVPLSGWLMVSSGKQFFPISMFGLFSWPAFPGVAHNSTAHAMGETHGLLVWGIILLFLLHIGGVLKHQFVDKDPSAERMVPVGRSMLSVGIIVALALMVGAIMCAKRIVFTPMAPPPGAVAAAPAGPMVAAPATAGAPAPAADHDGDGDGSKEHDAH